MSCKQIKQQLTTDCNASVTDGLYWLKGIQECPQSPDVPILVCVSTYVQTLIEYMINGTYANRFIVTCQNWMVGDGH